MIPLLFMYEKKGEVGKSQQFPSKKSCSCHSSGTTNFFLLNPFLCRSIAFCTPASPPTSRWHTVDLVMYIVTCIITRRGNWGTASRSSRYPIFFYACFSPTLCMVFCDYLAPSFNDRLLLGKILHHLLNRPYFPLHPQAQLINQVSVRMEK